MEATQSTMEQCACVDISLKSKYVKVKWLVGSVKSVFGFNKQLNVNLALFCMLVFVCIVADWKLNVC